MGLSPFLAGFLGSALAAAALSVVTAYLRRRYGLPEPHHGDPPLVFAHPRYLRVASAFMLLSSSLGVLSLFACALAFAHVLPSMAAALILMATAVLCGLVYTAGALSLKCPSCRASLLMDTPQAAPFAEKRMLLTGGHAVAISVLREGAFRCMQCGQSLTA
jgi:hypothetical protein